MCPQRDKEKDRCPHVSGNYDYDMCQPQTGLVVMNVSPEGHEERLVLIFRDNLQESRVAQNRGPPNSSACSPFCPPLKPKKHQGTPHQTKQQPPIPRLLLASSLEPSWRRSSRSSSQLRSSSRRLEAPREDAHTVGGRTPAPIETMGNKFDWYLLRNHHSSVS